MLSILIPVYNWTVGTLVKDLHQQCMASKKPFEIIVLDDASEQSYHKQNLIIKELVNTHYEQLEQNVGRASIRNLLAQKASYPYLLFIDSDAEVSSRDFINKYFASLHPSKLLYGGCIYPAQLPANPQKHLHYYFGKQREEIDFTKRQTTPYDAFKTFNFLIPKAIFSTILFDESIQEYGHEDTLFGKQLALKNITIKHINNPLVHIGLEDHQVFLQKQEQAIKTLYQLFIAKKEPTSRLLNTFEKCQRFGVTAILYRLLQQFIPFIKNQLTHSPPQLIYLDLYKLYHLMRIAQGPTS